MATAYKIEPEFEYSPAFISAVEQIATRGNQHWIKAADKRDGYVAESFRSRAAMFEEVRKNAVGANDGLTESIEALDEYFETDFLCIWKEADTLARTVQA